MAMKILAKGLVLNEGAYLQDQWNILDFFVVTTGWLFKLNLSTSNMDGLRALKILKPLKTISKT